jgi:1-acyl-sn-glycerol-3-phosphate acyltransferase
VARLGLEIYRVGGALLGWAVFLLLILLWGILVVPLTLLLLPVWPGVREHFTSLTRKALRAYVNQLSFLRICVEGAEMRIDGPRILVANHQSRLDSPVLLALEPRLCGPVRGYMLRVPIVGTVIRLVGFFDADAGQSAVFDAMNRAAERARSRRAALLFYPEGTRSATGEIGSFHRGAFRAAVDHDLPIQPVVIEGLDTVLPPGHVIPPVHGRYPARIRYLEALHPPYGTGLRRDVVRGLAEQVRSALESELASMRAERRQATAAGSEGS